MKSHFLSTGLILVFALITCDLAADEPAVPAELRRWLTAQNWQRDSDGPIVSLGASGQFDDTHVFAPCAALENNVFRLWYCGSTGNVAQRVFQLGLCTSRDGREFIKHSTNPVYSYGDGKHSVLTPALLRNADGSLLREGGKLRMWFSATDFTDPSGLHTLHEATSGDGIQFSPPSEAQLKGVYAPTVIFDEGRYRMWYTRVGAGPWSICYAESTDGYKWNARQEPCLVVDQTWEKSRLFYPAVIKADGVYLIWYGSYWNQDSQKTALGFAGSLDGLHWFKNPHNPVFTPDESRSWESHYTTSQSVVRLADGSWRMWYASRKKPPWINKYFAISTARWSGLQ